MVYPPKSYILNNSHLIGGERTSGIKFNYEIAKEKLNKKDNEKIFVNVKYISHFSKFNRFKRFLKSILYKIKF